MVSLPAPPSTVILISAAEISGGAEGVVAAVHVDDEVFGRAHIDAERCRIETIKAHACAVRGGGEDFGAVAAVDFRRVVAGAAFEQVGVVAGIPDHAVVTALAENLVVGVAAGQRIVACAAEQEVEAALAEQGVVAAFPNSMSPPDPPVMVSLPLPPKMLAAGRAPFASLSVMASLPPRPNT